MKTALGMNLGSGGELINASAKSCLVRYNEIHILSQVCCQPARGLATFSQGTLSPRNQAHFKGWTLN